MVKVELICKRLRVTSDRKETLAQDFAHELHILSSLRQLEHSNIINLVTSYTKGETYNFLFPVANGDLTDLLWSEEIILPGFQTSDEIISSLWGLSSALESMHDFNLRDFKMRQIGCHFDIQPRNILCLNGKLVLSDFGLSRLVPEENGSRSLFKRGEGSYIAPECEPSDRDFEPGKIGRASDVWSLGCILLEVLVYVAGGVSNGPRMVRQFWEERKIQLGPMICHHFHGINEVNPAVVKRLGELASNQSSPIKSLASLVEIMLQFHEGKRPKTPYVTLQLFKISQQEVFSEMCRTLGRCLDTKSLDLELEFERLKIWGKYAGLNSNSANAPKTAWFTGKHSVTEYENLQKLLDRCSIEIDSIAPQLKKESRGSDRLSDHLARLLDELWDMKPEPERKKMTGELEEAIMRKPYNNDLRDFQGSPEYLNIASSEDAQGDVSPRLDYRRIQNLRTVKEILSAANPENSASVDLVMRASSFTGPQKTLHRHSLLTRQETGERVLAEKLTYEGHWSSRVGELVDRVRSIASLRNRGIIKETFPVLQCVGFYNMSHRSSFSIVYNLPAIARNTDPLPLHQVFKETKARVNQPSLTQKFKLASILVSHVLNFHRGGWLHKSISSFNIIYFPSAFRTITESLSSPFFIGFNHSRYNDEKNCSGLMDIDADYHHPVYQQSARASPSSSANAVQRFCQQFDYYSVGMVLIEIAFWNSLDKVIKTTDVTPEEVRQNLLKEQMGVFRAYMGDAYAEAIRYCLDCYNGTDRDAEEVRNEFNDKVVSLISQCVI